MLQWGVLSTHPCTCVRHVSTPFLVLILADSMDHAAPLGVSGVPGVWSPWIYVCCALGSDCVDFCTWLMAVALFGGYTSFICSMVAGKFWHQSAMWHGSVLHGVLTGSLGSPPPPLTFGLTILHHKPLYVSTWNLTNSVKTQLLRQSSRTCRTRQSMPFI